MSANPKHLIGLSDRAFILPHNSKLYAILRESHTVLAYLFFLTFIAHFGVVLLYTLVLKDGLLMRMALFVSRR